MFDFFNIFKKMTKFYKDFFFVAKITKTKTEINISKKYIDIMQQNFKNVNLN